MTLRRFVPPPPRAKAPPLEVCGFCTEPLTAEHAHVVNLDSRSLVCACRGCYLLFTNASAAGGRFRSVPDRYLGSSEPLLKRGQWEELQIPVGTAFILYNSAQRRAVALYPSPAGATESQLPLGLWEELGRANPVVASLEPDVEALLVRAGRGEPDCWLVPIDACYELVGLIRKHWKGFDGGERARREIDAFFERVRARSESRSALCAS